MDYRKIVRGSALPKPPRGFSAICDKCSREELEAAWALAIKQGDLARAREINTQLNRRGIHMVLGEAS